MARNLGVAYTENKPYYFISYNSEDETRVAAFARELEKLGVPMWYDHGIKLGTEWENEIAEKIDSCEAVVMFLSKNIFAKENSYVHKEFELATEYSEKTVYVVMLDNIKKPEVPVRFRGWWTEVTKLQCVNAFEHTSVYECAGMLVREAGIKKISKAEVKPPEKAVAKGEIKTIEYKDGGVYKGEVKNGKRHGNGRFTWAIGDVYEGDWIDGKRTGKGRYEWPDGAYYEGDFVDGKIDGNGRKVWPCGDAYSGDWVDDNRTGKGRYEWPNGDVYIGDFKDGKMNGKGKYIWNDGTVYVGDMKDDKICGYGKKTYPDGRVEEGRFENGEFIG